LIEQININIHENFRLSKTRASRRHRRRLFHFIAGTEKQGNVVLDQNTFMQSSRQAGGPMCLMCFLAKKHNINLARLMIRKQASSSKQATTIDGVCVWLMNGEGLNKKPIYVLTSNNTSQASHTHIKARNNLNI